MSTLMDIQAQIAEIRLRQITRWFADAQSVRGAEFTLDKQLQWKLTQVSAMKQKELNARLPL